MQSISPAFARALVDAVEIADCCPRLRAALALDGGDTSSTPQIAVRDVCHFFKQAQLLLANEDLGLRAYRKAHPGHLGVLGYSLMSSPTLGEAIVRMAEQHSLIGTGFCMFVEAGPTEVRVAGLSASEHAEELHRGFIDAVAAITLGLLHWLAPSSEITPVKAEFTYAKPRDTRQLEKLFGSNLHFACPLNALTFRRCDTDIGVATFDPSLQQLLDHYLKRRHEAEHSDSLAVRVKRAALQHLHQAKPIGLEEIAQTLKISIHQLTGTLDRDGDSFLKLVDIVKSQHSRDLLLNTGLKLKQISYAVGFKHPSAFNKACERWFGMPPGAYRETHALQMPLAKNLGSENAPDSSH